MIVVAVIALNFACLRALSAYHPILPVAVALMVFALQVGVLGLYHFKDGRRPFLMGFVAFGTIAMATVLWGLIFAPSIGIACSNAGKTIKLTIPVSPLWSLWSGYVGFAATFLVKQLAIQLDPMSFLACLIWSLPQFLIALVGGSLTRFIARRCGHGPASSGSRDSLPSPPAPAIEGSRLTLAPLKS